MLKTKIRNFYNTFRYGSDEPIIEELKKHFWHEDRVGIYKDKRFRFDNICCEAAPGVLENIVLLLEGFKKENKNFKLLNIGSGSSQFDKILAFLDIDVYNTDIVINNEDEHNKWCDLNSQNPIPYDEKFDVVLAQEVIEHLENPWKFLRDLNSTLKEGGYSIITTPNIASKNSKKIFKKTGYYKWFTPDCLHYHINPISFWEIELIAEKTNFKVERIIGSGDYFFNRNKNKKKKDILSDNENLIFLLKKT